MSEPYHVIIRKDDEAALEEHLDGAETYRVIDYRVHDGKAAVVRIECEGGDPIAAGERLSEDRIPFLMTVPPSGDCDSTPGLVVSLNGTYHWAVPQSLDRFTPTLEIDLLTGEPSKNEQRRQQRFAACVRLLVTEEFGLARPDLID